MGPRPGVVRSDSGDARREAAAARTATWTRTAAERCEQRMYQLIRQPAQIRTGSSRSVPRAGATTFFTLAGSSSGGAHGHEAGSGGRAGADVDRAKRFYEHPVGVSTPISGTERIFRACSPPGSATSIRSEKASPPWRRALRPVSGGVRHRAARASWWAAGRGVGDLPQLPPRRPRLIRTEGYPLRVPDLGGTGGCPAEIRHACLGDELGRNDGRNTGQTMGQITTEPNTTEILLDLLGAPRRPRRPRRRSADRLAAMVRRAHDPHAKAGPASSPRAMKVKVSG
jgi:hypothetical protein